MSAEAIVAVAVLYLAAVVWLVALGRAADRGDRMAKRALRDAGTEPTGRERLP